MDWVLSAGVIISNIIVGRKNKWGWVLGACVSLGWVYYAWLYLNPPQYGLIPSALFNIGISAYNAYKWFKEDWNISK